jgi:hypothetical protein
MPELSVGQIIGQRAGHGRKLSFVQNWKSFFKMPKKLYSGLNGSKNRTT